MPNVGNVIQQLTDIFKLYLPSKYLVYHWKQIQLITNQYFCILKTLPSLNN